MHGIKRDLDHIEEITDESHNTLAFYKETYISWHQKYTVLKLSIVYCSFNC